jgi:hypothetical protein
MKIVINSDYGGFGLSEDGIREYGRRAGLTLVEDGPDNFGSIHFYKGFKDSKNYFSDYDLERNDPILVSVVEDLGEKAFGLYSKLKVIEIPDGIEWFISEYDGIEHVAEKHRTWY